VGSKLILTAVLVACVVGVLGWERMLIRVSQQAGETALARFRTEFTAVVLAAMSLLILGVWLGAWALWLAGAVFAIGVITVTARGFRRSLADRKDLNR
jgi:nicotinamide riboside transporter PnuC